MVSAGIETIGPWWREGMTAAAMAFVGALRRSGYPMPDPVAFTVDDFPDVFVINDDDARSLFMVHEEDGEIYFMKLSKDTSLKVSDLLAGMFPTLCKIAVRNGWKGFSTISNLASLGGGMEELLDGSLMCLRDCGELHEFLTVKVSDAAYCDRLDEDRKARFLDAVNRHFPPGATCVGFIDELGSLLAPEVLDELI